MKRYFAASLVCVAIVSGIVASAAQSDVTVHAAQSYSEGPLTRFAHFDVSLDGHRITADEAIYNPETGETELRGNVHIALPPHLDNKMTPGTVH